VEPVGEREDPVPGLEAGVLVGLEDDAREVAADDLRELGRQASALRALFIFISFEEYV
jgi:hypothetical protein